MDGIMMICLQALERKNKELDEANKRLEERLTVVEELTRKLSAPVTAAKR
jgi:cell shape-determining protein MreC